jgi:hypothetical protein
MTTPYTVSANVPLVPQHQPVFTGQPDPNADYDCGEGSSKSVAQFMLKLTDAQAKIMLDLEVIRAATIGYAGSGPTTPDHLQKVLLQLGIRSTLYNAATQSEYLYREWLYLKQGLPLIALRHLETITAPALHYCTVSQQTESAGTVMDPWITTAAFVTENYGAHWAMAETQPAWPNGTLLGIDGLA